MKEDEINRILNSMKGAERAAPSEHFTENLLSRIDTLKAPKTVRWLNYSIAAMIVMALLNTATLFLLPDTTISEDASLKSLSDDLLYQYQSDNLIINTDE